MIPWSWALGAAFFYSIVYDIQTFYSELDTIKVGFQATLSCLSCACAAHNIVVDYHATNPDYIVLTPTVLWSDLIAREGINIATIGNNNHMPMQSSAESWEEKKKKKRGKRNQARGFPYSSGGSNRRKDDASGGASANRPRTKVVPAWAGFVLSL